MDEDCNQSGPSSKIRKQHNEEPVEHAVSIPNNEPLPSIFKLDVDCLEEIFDYLSLKDLSSVGQTCTRMQKIAGYCYQQNYGAAKGSLVAIESIFVNYDKVNCFVDFIQKMEIGALQSSYGFNRDKLPHFINLLKNCKSIKEIEIRHINLIVARIESMKDILSKVECVTIDDCEYNGYLLDVVLPSCSNLKSLCIGGSALFGTDRLQWPNRYYPKLEYIEFPSFARGEIPALKTFFQLNTGIKRLAINDHLFWFNRQLIKATGIKFDVLAIKHHVLLNELYEENELYKKLHFYCSNRFNQNTIDQLAKLNKLVKLRAKSDSEHFNLSALINLEELCISKSRSISDLKSLPITLINLKRIHFGQASSDDILPFIQRAVKINKIKVLDLLNGKHFCERSIVLDLSALNKEREKLTDARKITIYVDEDIYLATKWAMKQTNFSLIEMKRADSYDWQHEFSLLDD